ncbi:MAG TPA: ATP-grasp domain-containing protein [Solirubrobacteraceae bacterium]|nr:ATP-grasp domain-containing protein [Solirubrobacteraceae bacterium]
MTRTLLLVGAGLLQIPAVEVAHELGLHVLATDRDPHAVAFAHADAAVVLDTKDVAGHVALARELAARGELAGVYTEGADVEVTVAEAARAAGLPGVDPRAARICADKAEFRRVCAAAGLPGPRFREVATLAEAHLALREIGLPVIVKALDNSGSRGATKVLAAEQLAGAFEEALRWTGGDTVLVEECLSGPEQSVETIVDQDRVQHRCNIVDRPFAFDPFPIELGHDNPTTLGAHEQQRLYELVEATTSAVGIDFGAAKADTIWTSRGPLVLEMTARLSGGFHAQHTSPLAHGTNEIKATLELALGRPLDPEHLRRRRHRHAICRALFPEPGLITAIDGVQDALAIDGVEHVLFRMGVGEQIRPYRTCADRAGFVIACADTRERALHAVAEAQRRIVVSTTPGALVGQS